jgi:hypothetical protein
MIQRPARQGSRPTRGVLLMARADFGDVDGSRPRAVLAEHAAPSIDFQQWKGVDPATNALRHGRVDIAPAHLAIRLRRPDRDALRAGARGRLG